MNLNLTEYRQDVSVIGAEPTYEPVTFNGTSPLLKLANKTFCVVRQSGRGLVWFGRLTPPVPIVESPVYLSKPDIKYTRPADKPWAWETTWEYVMLVDDGDVPDAEAIAGYEAWPDAPVIT